MGTSAELLDWISRLGRLSGDSRIELGHLARRHAWTMQSFGELVAGEADHVTLRSALRPVEVAAVVRAWTTDFRHVTKPASPVQQPVKPTTFHDGFGNVGPAGCPPCGYPGWRKEATAAGGGHRHALSSFPPEPPPGTPPWPRPQPARSSCGYQQGGRLEAPPEPSPPISRRVPAANGGAQLSPSSVRAALAQGDPQAASQRRADCRSSSAAPCTPCRTGNAHLQRGRSAAATASALARPADRIANHEIAASPVGRHYMPVGPDPLIPPPRAGCVSGQPNMDLDGVWHSSQKDVPSLAPSQAVIAAESIKGRATSSPEHVFHGAYCIAVSSDYASIYVVGVGGLSRFDSTSLELLANAPYCGNATSEGYADVATGSGSVVCVDLEGTLYGHDPVTCNLLMQRAYQPSVVEPCQRLVAGRLRKFNAAVFGLEGGFGGAARVAIGQDAVYLGGKDGVVTCHALGSLNIISRASLSEGPQSLGIRVVYLAPSGRLYCGAQYTLHVLTAGLQTVVKLRGGPKQPVFGSCCSVVETNDGRLALSGDDGGPAIHAWDTSTWGWLFRVELTSGCGLACHLAVSPDDALLFAATEWHRFLAFRLDTVDSSRKSWDGRPQCVADGGGGGPLAVLQDVPHHVIVLSHRRLVLRAGFAPEI